MHFKFIHPDKVKSFADLITVIINARRKAGETESVWFRGQNDSEYHLEPGAYREFWYVEDDQGRPIEPCKRIKDYYVGGYKGISIDLTSEEEFFEIMREKGIAYDKSASIASQAGLAQHYGVKKTLLLDWTTDATVALFFAVYNRAKEKDAAFYILNPEKLNEIYSKDHDHLVYDSTDVTWRQEYPIAFIGDKNNQRICRQSGNFTMHGKVSMPLDSFDRCDEFLEKWIIPYSVCEDIEKLLVAFGITEDSIFVKGSARDVREYMADLANQYAESALDAIISERKFLWLATPDDKKGQPPY